MAGEVVYVLHPEPAIAGVLSRGLSSAGFEVLSLSSVDEVENSSSDRQLMIPDAILTPLGDSRHDESILVALFKANPLLEQIPLVAVASSEREERRRALRMGLLSVVYPPYDAEEVVLTTKLAIERQRTQQRLFGSLEQLSVPELLQTAEAGRRSGTLTFRNNGTTGIVWMKDGYVVDAEVGGERRGQEAVYRIALWKTGTFDAEFGTVDVGERIRVAPSTLLLEAMRRFDEESAVNAPVPSEQHANTEVADLALIVVNAAAGYADNHLRPRLVRDRLESLRSDLAPRHPVLEDLRIGEGGAVVPDANALVGRSAAEVVTAVSTLVCALYDRMDASLAWRFGPERLAGLLAPWRPALKRLGFDELLEAAAAPGCERSEVVNDSSAGTGAPVPVGCLELDGNLRVVAFSPYGPQIGRVDPSVLLRRRFDEVLSGKLSELFARLRRRLHSRAGDCDGIATGRTVLRSGRRSHTVRLALVRPVSQSGLIVIVNRLRSDDRSLSPEIERDPVSGTLQDGHADRLLVVNDDFLYAFEDLFSGSFCQRQHQFLQRFGKKWGLRHAMRLEHIVQRDYGMTLREMESQMALELLSSSLGLFGLGRFQADLQHRDQGLVVIRHQASPFPGIMPASAGRSCSILSGFHAATLSYLAGRHLAAREVLCASGRDEACTFVIGTEDRLTKLLIATPRSADCELLEDIKREQMTVGKAS